MVVGGSKQVMAKHVERAKVCVQLPAKVLFHFSARHPTSTTSLLQCLPHHPKGSLPQSNPFLPSPNHPLNPTPTIYLTPPAPTRWESRTLDVQSPATIPVTVDMAVVKVRGLLLATGGRQEPNAPPGTQVLVVDTFKQKVVAPGPPMHKARAGHALVLLQREPVSARKVVPRGVK